MADTARRSVLSYTSVVLVACVAVLLGLAVQLQQQPQLDWDNTILPMARQRFHAQQLDDARNDEPMDGIIVVVTGSTSGIGYALTKALVKLGATVICLNRNGTKLEEMQLEFNNSVVEGLVVDFNNLQSVQQVSSLIRERFHHIDILVNNAGIHYGWTTPGHPESTQGYDLAFQVNYLSHFLLTESMIPLLLNSTEGPTIVQTSSSLHWAVDGLDLECSWDGQVPPTAARPGGGMGSSSSSTWYDDDSLFMIWRRDQRAYANSKLAQILHARAVQRRHHLDDLRVVSICPGWVGTQLAGPKGSIKYALLNSLGLNANEWGIASLLHAILYQNNDKGDNDDDAAGDGDYIISSTFPTLFPYLAPRNSFVRDVVYQFLTFAMVIGQKLTAQVVTATSSPESYNETLQESLYQWSKQAVSEYV